MKPHPTRWFPARELRFKVFPVAVAAADHAQAAARRDRGGQRPAKGGIHGRQDDRVADTK